MYVPKLLKLFGIVLLTSRSCRILCLGECLDDGSSLISFINFQHYFITWIIPVCKAVMKIYKPRHTVLLVLCLLWWKKPNNTLLPHQKTCLPQANRISTSLFSISSSKKLETAKNPSVTFLFNSSYVNFTWVNPESLWKGGYNLTWTGKKGQMLWLDIPF